jgi:chaperone modulatory protein CbpM
MDENIVFTLAEVRERLSLDDEMIAALREQGLLASENAADPVNHKEFQRVQTAICLYHDLGVNMAGAALALDMLERLAVVERELAILRRHLG